MILETKKVVKVFGKLVATNSVSLAVRPGDIHAIIGPNGAGKSTYFNLITGYHLPDSGQVFFKGKDITKLPPYRRCRMGITRSFQITSIYPKLTVYESVLMALLSHQKKTLGFLLDGEKLFSRRRSGGSWRTWGWPTRPGLNGDSISHGDKKRLELAVTLGTKPELLLLDEPTCGMSPEETDSIMEIIKKLVDEKGLTIFFTEHDMAVVFGIARRISVLHQGTLIADGTPEEVRASEQVQKVYLGGAA